MKSEIEKYWNANKSEIRKLYQDQPLDRTAGALSPAEYIGLKLGTDKYFMCCVLHYAKFEDVI